MPRTLIRHERRTNGTAVQTFRELAGRSLADVAAAAGKDANNRAMAPSTLYRIETGERQPSLDVMCRIANALGVPLDAISHIVSVYVADEMQRPVGVVTDADGNAA